MTNLANQRVRVAEEAADGARHIARPAFPPAFWLQWVQRVDAGEPVGSAPVPSCGWTDVGDLLARHNRLVVVSPHPDDEVLMCSGLLVEQSLRKGAIAIVSVTDGEACFGADTGRTNIGAERREESDQGLIALGASAAVTHHLGLPDGGVVQHERAAAEHLGDLLVAGDLVVSTWRLDGHPDHDATGRASAKACTRRGATLLEAPVWMWHWARPGHPAIDFQKLTAMPLSTNARERKWQALQCHQSQLTAHAGAPPIVDEALQQRARWPFECFFKGE